MNRIVRLFFVLSLSIASIACAEKDTKAPRVIETHPMNESTDVDPSLSEISVTFNEPMMDGNWSWAYTEKNEFPKIKGQPYYSENYTKNNLPVILEPGKQYIIWINSEKFKNFKDKAGNPALPFKFTFKTR